MTAVLEARSLTISPEGQVISPPTPLEKVGTPAELMRSQGDSVGYYERIPGHVKNAWVIEEGSNGRDLLTHVTPGRNTHLIDVFDAATDRRRVVGVLLEGPKIGGLPTVQTVFNNADINTVNGTADVALPGHRSVTRSSSPSDKTTNLPAGYLTGTR